MGDDEQNLINTMKISEPRKWYLRVETLAREKKWALLQQFVERKKSPIGYMPIVEACVENGSKRYARDYILRLSDPGEKMEWLATLEFWDDAVDVAEKAK